MVMTVDITGAAGTTAAAVSPWAVPIAAGAQILGGLMTNKSNAKAAKNQQLADIQNAVMQQQFNEQNTEYQYRYNSSLMQQQEAYNSQNLRDQYDLNQKAALQQQGYETNLANTAHQREVADLRAAGLNPILSGMGGGGASTPNGAFGQVGLPSVGSQSVGLASSSKANASMAHQMTNPAAGAVSSAQAQALMEAQLKTAEINNANTEANTDLQIAQRGQTLAETAVKGVDYENKVQNTQLQAAQTLSEQQNIPLRQAQTKVAESQVGLNTATAALTSASAKSAQVQANADTWAQGQGLTNMERAGQAASGATSAVRNLPNVKSLIGGFK